MSIWNKLVTAMRGGVNELGEAVADSQALRILDQEIREADEELKKAKESLASLVAKYKMAQASVKKVDTQIAQYEGYAIKALQQGDESLGLEIAGKIANLENIRKEEAEQARDFEESVVNLRKAVGQVENKIRHLRQQVDTVRATESVQRAQLTVAKRQGGSHLKLQTAIESLERIKKRQAERNTRLEAENELDDSGLESNLEAKLKAVGIIDDKPNAESVLAKLRAKSGN